MMALPLILLVDDETVGLEVRRMLLDRAGYRVLTALSGVPALELFCAHPVQAVVLDYSMPGMTGGQVAAEMRRLKPHIPILMLSAYTSLPAEVGSLVDLSMTKGEGPMAFLEKLSSLFVQDASHP